MIKRSQFILFLTVMVFIISCNDEYMKGKSIASGDFFLEEITIPELQQGYKNGDFSIKEVVQAYLDRIVAIDQSGPELHAVIQVNPDALQIAEALDKELQEGKSRGPLHGVPVLLKDNIDTHDKMETTAGSRALKGSYPLQDSWVAKKLRDAGAVIIGKANLSEWANFRGSMSSSGWSGLGGQTKNPYVLDRNPCGSSSGSAAGVSANLSMLAIGTETNGSIVCPSSANGVVGIKPTVGLVSRSGVIPISFSQDIPGPIARTVRDAAICLGALTGVDPNDSKTLDSKGKFHTDYTIFLKKNGLKGKKIGLYTKPLGKHYKVDTLMNRAVRFLKSQGVEVIEIDQIGSEDASSNSFNVMLYEYKDGLNKYFASLGENAPVKNLDELIVFNEKDSVELKFYNQKYLIMAREKGDLNSEKYKNALEKMHKGMREEGIDKVMDEYKLDAIIAPTGGPAWKTDHINGDAFHVGSSSPAAIAGYPNITVPMGYLDDMPVGISFFGRAWSEPVLLEIAYAYETANPWRRVPEFKVTD